MSSFDALLLGSEAPFATGAATYADRYPGLAEPHPRIYVEFRPTGCDRKLVFPALLDTGGHYCILNEDVATLISDQLTEYLGETTLRTAHGLLRGTLHIVPIELIAEVGENLNLEVVAFIPSEWRGPSFFGYTGVLDRLRFAIHAETNRFYFGPRAD